MKRQMPDLFWIVAFAVVIGAASSLLQDDTRSNLQPQQAGILVQ